METQYALVGTRIRDCPTIVQMVYAIISDRNKQRLGQVVSRGVYYFGDRAVHNWKGYPRSLDVLDVGLEAICSRCG